MDDDKVIFPDVNMPIIYIDGVTNISTVGTVCKIILSRIDPSISGSLETNTVNSHQLIIPTTNLLDVVVFLEQSLLNLEKMGFLKEGSLDMVRDARATAAQK